MLVAHRGASSLKETNKQVRQQACKMQIPPYGLMQRRSLQFRLPHRASPGAATCIQLVAAYILEVMPPL